MRGVALSLHSELVDLAVDEVCRAAGLHAVCPIAVELVKAARRSRERDPEVGGSPPVPVGDRQRAVRPDGRRRTATQLPETEDVFKFPPMVPPIPIRLQRSVTRGMVRHVTRAGIGGTRGAPVGAGGRVVRSIAQSVISGGNRRRLNGQEGPGFFFPGEPSG